MGAVLGALLFVSAIIATVLLIKWRITRKVLLMQAVLDNVLLLPYYFRYGKRAALLHITTSTKSDGQTKELESHSMENDTEVDSQFNQYSVFFMQLHKLLCHHTAQWGNIYTCPGIQQSIFC